MAREEVASAFGCVCGCELCRMDGWIMVTTGESALVTEWLHSLSPAMFIHFIKRRLCE